MHTTGTHHYQQRTTSMNSGDDKPQTVDRAYIREYLASLKKPEYAKCRGNHHAFPDKGKLSAPDPDDNSIIERVVRCRRCRVTRTETLHLDHENRTAHQFAVKLTDYPEGYLMEPGHGRLDSDDFAAIRYENIYNEMRRQAGDR